MMSAECCSLAHIIVRAQKENRKKVPHDKKKKKRKRYPAEDEYNEYLAKHGGSSNAYTSSTQTVYYFNVAKVFFIGFSRRTYDVIIAIRVFRLALLD